MSDRSLRPLAVLVSGVPGSGKTTLSGHLGERLHLPVLSKDRLREGTLLTLRATEIDAAPPGPPLWYGALEALLGLGISVIGDMALFAGVSDHDIQNRLAPVADLFNVHCQANNSAERLTARVAEDPLRAHYVDSIAEQIPRWEKETGSVLDLGCPCLVVDTTDGYDPCLDHVVAAIREFAYDRHP